MTLFINHPGFARQIVYPANRPLQSRDGPMRIILRPEAAIAGVYRIDGKPESGVDIYLFQPQVAGQLEENFGAAPPTRRATSASIASPPGRTACIRTAARRAARSPSASVKRASVELSPVKLPPFAVSAESQPSANRDVDRELRSQNLSIEQKARQLDLLAMQEESAQGLAGGNSTARAAATAPASADPSPGFSKEQQSNLSTSPAAKNSRLIASLRACSTHTSLDPKQLVRRDPRCPRAPMYSSQ